MNADSIDSSRSSSPVNLDRPSKRQGLETSASSSLTTSANDSVLRPERESTQLRELAVLRKRLSHTEATAVQHKKIRNEIEELCEKEKSILEMQVQMDKETIEQLQEALEKATKTTNEARNAQAAAEAELFRVQTAMEQQITALVMENARLKESTNHSNSARTSTSSRRQKDDEETHADEDNPMDFEESKTENPISQEELNPHDIEVKDVRVIVQRFHPESPSTDDKTGKKGVRARATLANKSQKVASPRKKKTSPAKKRLDAGERVEDSVVHEQSDKPLSKRRTSRTSSGTRDETISPQKQKKVDSQVDGPQRKSKRIKVARGSANTKSKESEVNQDDTLNSGDNEDAVSEVSREYDPYPDPSEDKDPLALVSEAEMSDESDDHFSHLNHDEDAASDLSEPPEAPDVPENNDYHLNSTELNGADSSFHQSTNYLRIRVGRHYSVFTSSRKFQELNWNDEYLHKESGGWQCNKCSLVITTKKQRMEDHVWTTHYAGKFHCPHCNPYHPLFTSRESIFNHMERKHPHLLKPKDESINEVIG